MIGSSTRRFCLLEVLLILSTLLPTGQSQFDSNYEKCACGHENYRAGLNPADFDPDEVPFEDSTNSPLYPWVVGLAIRDTNTILCSGVLVSWTEVLTTGPCAFKFDTVHNPPSDGGGQLGDVLLGTANTLLPQKRISFEARGITYGGSVRGPKHYDDFGLWQNFQDNMAIIYIRQLDVGTPMDRRSLDYFPICVRQETLSPSIGTTTPLRASGWGYIDGKSSAHAPDQVQTVLGYNFWTQTPRECITKAGDVPGRFKSEDQVLCFGDHKDNDIRFEMCSSDNGGPLQVEGGELEDFRWYLAGVSSKIYPPILPGCTRLTPVELFINIHSTKSEASLFGTNSLSKNVDDCKRQHPPPPSLSL